MPDENAQKSILIVEDDETLQQTLAYNLRAEGYIVHTARDGYSGLEAARAEPLDQALERLFAESRAFTQGTGRHDDTSVVLVERYGD